MKYTFKETTRRPTHTRTADGVEGMLFEHPGTATITPASAEVNAGDYEAIAPPVVAPTPDPVPSPVARLPFRNALLSEFGITFAGLHGVLDSMPDGIEKEQAIIQLEEAAEIHRDNPLVEQIRTILGKTPEQTDNLFRVAGMTA